MCLAQYNNFLDRYQMIRDVFLLATQLPEIY